MKRNIFAVLAAVTLVIVMASGAWAADVNVTVDANVQAKCVFVSDGSIAAFNIDPDSGVINKTTAADGTPGKVKCTKGSPLTVTCSPALAATGVLTMVGDTPGGDITYTVTSCAGTSPATGFGGAGDDVNVGIQIAANAAANSAAGAHTGTVVVTVMP